MKSSANLDLLRAISVLFVVVDHVGIQLGVQPEEAFMVMGLAGVSMFFVHTCLVLMLSLERAPAALPFYVRRAFRIYPLAIAATLFVVLGRGSSEPAVLLSNLLLVQNIPGHESLLRPMWSLPYEVQMYLVLPLLFLLVRRKGVVPVVLLLVGSMALLGALSAFGINRRIVEYLPCFLPGVLAYALSKRMQRRHSPLLLFSVVFAGTALAYLASNRTVALWGLCLGVGVAIPMCREITYAPLTRAAKLIADYSYAIYLTHTFAIFVGFAMFPDLALLFKFALFAFALAAWARVCYRWIELPGIALGKRIAQRRELRGVRVVSAE